MFLKNKNIIFNIRRSKVTDYAALIDICCGYAMLFLKEAIQMRTENMHFVS